MDNLLANGCLFTLQEDEVQREHLFQMLCVLPAAKGGSKSLQLAPFWSQPFPRKMSAPVAKGPLVCPLSRRLVLGS